MVRHVPAAKPAAAPRQHGPGRPKDLGKRAAVLDAARRLFIEQGYERVSMDQISSAAGVSKLTVYSHFGDKATLFAQAIRAQCETLIPDELFIADTGADLRQRLDAIGHAFFQLITSPEALATQRAMQDLANADPRLSQLFWCAGPERVMTALSGLLQVHIDRGDLDIPPAALPRAASQLFSLLKGELHARMTCGVALPCDQAEVDAHIAATVDFFLRAYAPR